MGTYSRAHRAIAGLLSSSRQCRRSRSLGRTALALARLLEVDGLAAGSGFSAGAAVVDSTTVVAGTADAAGAGTAVDRAWGPSSPAANAAPLIDNATTTMRLIIVFFMPRSLREWCLNLPELEGFDYLRG